MIHETNLPCVLCASDGGRVVWRNDALRVVAVDDPMLPGYTRVIWAEHLPEMSDLGTREQQHLMQAVFLVEEVARQILQPDKVNLASLGNMAPHLHWHIMPRWRGDPWFPDSIWAQRRERAAAADADWKQHCRQMAPLKKTYESALRASLDRL